MPKKYVFVNPRIAKMKLAIYLQRIRDLETEQFARKLGNASIFYFKTTPHETTQNTPHSVPND